MKCAPCIALFSVAAVAGCGGARQSVTAFRTVVDSSGRYPVVRVTGEPPTWRLDSLATLVDSGNVGFTRIYAVLIDPLGGVLVFRNNPAAIDRFDDHGHMLGVVGRTGSGPGEYRMPIGGGWVDTSLVVYDYGNGRIVEWGDSGRVWPALRACCGLQMLVPDGPSHLWALAAERAHGQTATFGYVRLPAGARPDTIWPIPRPKIVSGPTCRWGKGNLSFFNTPFGIPAFAVAPLPDGGFAELNGAEYRVVLRAAAGDTVRVLERDLPPVPITDLAWHDSTSDYRDFLSRHGDANCDRAMTRPASKVIPVTLEVGRDGKIWVERRTARGRAWDIWDHNRLLGSVLAPTRSDWQPMDVDGDRVAVVRYRASDGGWEVHSYRVEPPAELPLTAIPPVP